MNVNDPTLRRFWFEFEGIRIKGYGVTAIDLADARSLIERLPKAFRPTGSPTNVIEDVDIRTLDAGHVVPNMGAPVRRGVWYPNLTDIQRR
jgi:hypothetical protein